MNASASTETNVPAIVASTELPVQTETNVENVSQAPLPVETPKSRGRQPQTFTRPEIMTMVTQIGSGIRPDFSPTILYRARDLSAQFSEPAGNVLFDFLDVKNRKPGTQGARKQWQLTEAGLKFYDGEVKPPQGAVVLTDEELKALEAEKLQKKAPKEKVAKVKAEKAPKAPKAAVVKTDKVPSEPKEKVATAKLRDTIKAKAEARKAAKKTETEAPVEVEQKVAGGEG